jgi:hypothetical protein
VGLVAGDLQFDIRKAPDFEQTLRDATRRRFFKQLEEFLFHGTAAPFGSS